MEEIYTTKVSYKKLWKMLIDRELKKTDLQKMTNVSWTSITKMSKNEIVSMPILIKVCNALNCDICDVVELVRNN